MRLIKHIPYYIIHIVFIITTSSSHHPLPIWHTFLGEGHRYYIYHLHPRFPLFLFGFFSSSEGSVSTLTIVSLSRKVYISGYKQIYVCVYIGKVIHSCIRNFLWAVRDEKRSDSCTCLCCSQLVLAHFRGLVLQETCAELELPVQILFFLNFIWLWRCSESCSL